MIYSNKMTGVITKFKISTLSLIITFNNGKQIIHKSNFKIRYIH